MPRIGETLPNFTARTTAGMQSLSDYRGQWLVLFSHPADFTPVCTSEFVAIARAAPRFQALGCALLALSVDSLYAHLAWIRLIHDRFGVRVEFPIIEDPTLEIARGYGMVGADATDAGPVRTTYFIDPNGILRASICYPATVGRSVEEMLRVLAALQRVDRGPVFTPAEWRPGDDVLKAASHDIDDILSGNSATDWFYTTVPDSSR